MNASALLASVPLFAGLPDDERDNLGRLMHPFAVPAGAELFTEGDPGDHMYVIEEGSLGVSRSGPGGRTIYLATVGAGEVLGEMSLMSSGARTATVTAAEPTHGWALQRAVFDVLRADVRAGSLALMRRIGDLATERLRDRYAVIAGSLGGGAASAAEPAALEPVSGTGDDAAYLAGTLFFAGSSEDEIGALVAGARRFDVPRGSLLCAAGARPPALYVVVRGAVESNIRGGSMTRRVRLAGPGRAVGHLGVLGDAPSVIECRTRERTILIEFPWARVAELLDAQDHAARAFTAALNVDVVRALLAAERPMTQMVAA